MDKSALPYLALIWALHGGAWGLLLRKLGAPWAGGVGLGALAALLVVLLDSWSLPPLLMGLGLAVCLLAPGLVINALLDRRRAVLNPHGRWGTAARRSVSGLALGCPFVGILPSLILARSKDRKPLRLTERSYPLEWRVTPARKLILGGILPFLAVTLLLALDLGGLGYLLMAGIGGAFAVWAAYQTLHGRFDQTGLTLGRGVHEKHFGWGEIHGIEARFSFDQTAVICHARKPGAHLGVKVTIRLPGVDPGVLADFLTAEQARRKPSVQPQPAHNAWFERAQ